MSTAPLDSERISSGEELAAELRQRIAEMTPADLGRLMRREGAPKWANPYTGADMSLRHAAWLEGWQEAETQPAKKEAA